MQTSVHSYAAVAREPSERIYIAETGETAEEAIAATARVTGTDASDWMAFPMTPRLAAYVAERGTPKSWTRAADGETLDLEGDESVDLKRVFIALGESRDGIDVDGSRYVVEGSLVYCGRPVVKVGVFRADGDRGDYYGVGTALIDRTYSQSRMRADVLVARAERELDRQAEQY